jgi:hypothetical protein
MFNQQVITKTVIDDKCRLNLLKLPYNITFFHQNSQLRF